MSKISRFPLKNIAAFLSTDEEKIELRQPSGRERLKGLGKMPLDPEAVVDSVVATTKDGRSYLLGIVDSHGSSALNYESGLAALIGLVPIVGPAAAATLALKDITKAGIPLVKAKAAHNRTDPADRALLRMGLKHLALVTASVATGGASHVAVVALEVASAAKDFKDAGPTSFGEFGRSIRTALTGLLSVKAHGHGEPAPNSIRIVLLKELPHQQKVSLEEAGRAVGETGPPSSS